ncbi:GNAT family N-acetyltransferase [Kiloniella antarctica]
MENISVIRADESNVQEAAGLFDLYRQFYGQKSAIESCTEYLQERQRLDESTVFFAKDTNGNVLGFTQLYPAFSSISLRRDLVLNDLFVLEKARGRGIARKLLQAAKEHAQKVNSKGLLLETDILNANAQALYESFGFERITDHYFYYLNV